MTDLLKTHKCDRYAFTRSRDSMSGNVEALGSREAANLDCRMVPSTAADRQRYGVVDQQEFYRACFGTDPSALNKALVWNSKVWRVRDVVNSGGVGFIWVAFIEHCPQVELPTP